MKLSEKTISILKNFASINPSIVLVPGKVQQTIEIDGVILAIAKVEDDFPAQAPFYDLPQFLANISLLNNPTLTFGQTAVEIDDGEVHIEYRYCKPSAVVTPPPEPISIDDPGVPQFLLTKDNFNKLLKIATLNGLVSLTMVGKDGSIFLKTRNKEDKTSSIAKTKICTYTGPDFSVDFKIENLRMIPDDYNVMVSTDMASFENKDKTLQYFVAQDKKGK